MIEADINRKGEVVTAVATEVFFSPEVSYWEYRLVVWQIR
jgi:hypothetical protein